MPFAEYAVLLRKLNSQKNFNKCLALTEFLFPVFLVAAIILLQQRSPIYFSAPPSFNQTGGKSSLDFCVPIILDHSQSYRSDFEYSPLVPEPLVFALVSSAGNTPTDDVTDAVVTVSKCLTDRYNSTSSLRLVILRDENDLDDYLASPQ